MRRIAPQLFAQLFCIPLTLFIVSQCRAQLPIRPNTSPGDMQQREWELGNIRRDVGRDVSSQYSREKLLAQMALREDFRKLQIVNNDLMKRRFVPSFSITAKEIRSSLGKIKELAQRLRTSFAIPAIDSDKKSDNNHGPGHFTLSRGLLLLDKAVMSFVENPMFQQTRVFNTELALQAGKDLNEIVRLSDVLRELAKDPTR